MKYTSIRDIAQVKFDQKKKKKKLMYKNVWQQLAMLVLVKPCKQIERKQKWEFR